MKKYIFILGIILISNAVALGQTTKILFLGNSYTGANNLPEKVDLLAASLGDSVYYDSNTPGGYRLMNHASDPTTLQKISQDDWDYVVIQAQSQEPSWSPNQVIAEVLPYAAILNDSIKANNACSETVFYMTWGRKYGDQSNCASWPPVCTFLGMQQRLMVGYMAMGEQNSSTVAPVGLSWKHAMDNDPDSLIDLYISDYSHPSLAGTYLTACVMYATMFQKSPVGSEYYAGVPENHALFLQYIAEYVVLGDEYNFVFSDPYTNINFDLGWESWFDFGNIIFPGFSFTGISPTYSFLDHSLNATSYFWDFGDGGYSTLQNPTYTYTQSGNYTITQSCHNTCFHASASDTIDVVIVSNDEMIDQDMVSVFPNPGNGIFELTIKNQEWHDGISYEVMDLNGKSVRKGTLNAGKSILHAKIDLSSVNKGFYYLRVYLKEEMITKTLIVQ